MAQARTSLAQARSSNQVNDASLDASVQQATQSLADAKQSAAMDIASAEAAVTQAQQQLQTDQARYNLDAGTLNGIFGETPGAKGSREAAQAAVNNDAAQIQQIREFQAKNAAPYPAGYDQLALQQLQYRQTQDQAVLTALTTLFNDQLTLDKDQQAIASAQRALTSTKAKAEQSQRTAANQLETAKQNVTKSGVSNTQSVTNAENQLQQALQSTRSTKLKSAQSIATAQAQLATAQQNLRSGAVKSQQSLASAQTAVATAQQNLRSGVVKNQQSLASAQSSVANARTSLDSAKAGVEVKEATATASALAQARASVVSARANLANATVTLGQTTLLAPAAGTITAVNGTVGGSSSGSSASSSSGGATASTSSSSSSSGLVSMIGNATLQVRAGFGEADAAKIAVGQPATITVSALPDTTLSARVVQVDQTSTVVSNVVTYYVTLQLDRKVEGLKPGMTVTAQVIADKRDGALHVPSAAVTGTGASARVTVVAADGTQTTKTVVAGLVGDESTEIVSGLSVGQTVVTATATTTAGTGQSGQGGFPGGGGLPGGGGFPGGGLPRWGAARWLTPSAPTVARRRSCSATFASRTRWARTRCTRFAVSRSGSRAARASRSWARRAAARAR